MIAHLDDEESSKRLSSELSIISDSADCAVLVANKSCISLQTVNGGETDDGFVLIDQVSYLEGISSSKAGSNLQRFGGSKWPSRRVERRDLFSCVCGRSVWVTRHQHGVVWIGEQWGRKHVNADALATFRLTSSAVQTTPEEEAPCWMDPFSTDGSSM